MNDPLDDLLAEANEALTPVPPGLARRIERRLSRARRYRFATLTTAVAASVAALWLLRPEAPRHDLPVAPLPVATAPTLPDPVRVTFPAGSGVTAVPVPAESPNVTVLWLFPAPLPPAERNDS